MILSIQYVSMTFLMMIRSVTKIIKVSHFAKKSLKLLIDGNSYWSLIVFQILASLNLKFSNSTFLCNVHKNNRGRSKRTFSRRGGLMERAENGQWREGGRLNYSDVHNVHMYIKFEENLCLIFFWKISAKVQRFIYFN